jgi:predicted GIY-YIG superfamily endonuclease
MTHSIYCIVNLVNGKRYVGQTINPRKRWREHVNAARKGRGQLLGAAIRKHGNERVRPQG